MGLDDSQLDSLKIALTKELAIIQGPPGTGKTYMGLKAGFFLSSKRSVQGRIKDARGPWHISDCLTPTPPPRSQSLCD